MAGAVLWWLVRCRSKRFGVAAAHRGPRLLTRVFAGRALSRVAKRRRSSCPFTRLKPSASTGSRLPSLAGRCSPTSQSTNAATNTYTIPTPPPAPPPTEIPTPTAEWMPGGGAGGVGGCRLGTGCLFRLFIYLYALLVTLGWGAAGWGPAGGERRAGVAAGVRAARRVDAAARGGHGGRYRGGRAGRARRLGSRGRRRICGRGRRAGRGGQLARVAGAGTRVHTRLGAEPGEWPPGLHVHACTCACTWAPV